MEVTTEQIIGAVGALVGAIVWLAKVIYDSHKETRKNLQDQKERYENLHEKANKEMRELHGKVERLAGEKEGVIFGVEKISSDVIEEIRKLRQGE